MAIETERLRERLRGLGFDVVRFARIDGAAPGAEALQAWLAAGRQADMDWIERSLPRRRDPRQVVAGALSLVLLGVNYGPGAPAAPDRPRWARYALHDDYHDTIKAGLAAAGRVLEAEAGIGPDEHRYYVDTGPVLERSWAAAAGLGFTGKNAMLISPDYGNWLFLAAIVTTAELPPDRPLGRRREERPVGTLCGSCTRCIDVCPTAALVAPGVLDARRCISYQTIENKGVIPRELRPAIGDLIYGCDLCAEVCPWNRFAQAARSGLLRPRPEIAQLTLPEILRLTPERFAATFKGTAIKRVKLRGLLRNACIVAANTNRTDCLDDLVALTAQAEPVVRAHAVWAVRRLGAGDRLQAQAEAESDPVVREEYRTPV